MRGSLEQFESCQRAAKARSKEGSTLITVVYLREDGHYGWSLWAAPKGAQVISRYCGGKRSSDDEGETNNERS